MQDLLITRFVKKHDYDRYLSTIFAPDQNRYDLNVLYAFNIEVARISENTSEILSSLLRIQWWRDAIEEIYQGKIRDHFISKPLFHIIHKYNLPKNLFDELLVAREFDFYHEPPKDLNELKQYAIHTSFNLLLLSLKILGKSDFTEKFAQDFAIASCIIGNLRVTKFIPKTNRTIIFPQNYLKKQNLNQEEIFFPQNLPKIKEIVRELVSISEELVICNFNKIERANKPIFLPLLGVKNVIKNIKKNGYDILNKDIEPCRPAILLKMALSML